MGTTLTVLLGITALSIANVWVCSEILQNPWYSQLQKALQCAFVWFVPVLGLIIVWSFSRSQSRTPRERDGFVPQRDQFINGSEFNDPGISGGAHHEP